MRGGAAPYLTGMRALAPLLLLPLLSGSPAAAAEIVLAQATRPAPAAAPLTPKSIGVFTDWQAATLQEGGQLVCYAFTRASASAPAPAVPNRGAVVMTVTQRSGTRDAVALSAGFAYPAGAEVEVGVDQTELAFYTAGRSAFARDGRASIEAFQRGRTAVARSPGPRSAPVQDTFSLRGFTAAYDAINKACPAR